MYPDESSLRSLDRVFSRAGFQPPNANWTRPDPRGREYGTWTASSGPSEGEPIYAQFINGPKSATGVAIFTISFPSVRDFEKWVNHTF